MKKSSATSNAVCAEPSRRLRLGQPTDGGRGEQFAGFLLSRDAALTIRNKLKFRRRLDFRVGARRDLTGHVLAFGSKFAKVLKFQHSILRESSCLLIFQHVQNFQHIMRQVSGDKCQASLK